MTIVTECTESQVQARIMFDKGSASSVILPNYAPPNWWENDVFQITKAGYWVEYEIKRSVPDYRADFRKADEWHGKNITKHALLATDKGAFDYDPYEHVPPLQGRHTRTRRLPNRFFFCLPVELLDKLDPPEYAGIIAFEMKGGRTVYRVHRPAPLRHRIKHGEKISLPAFVTGQRRYNWQFMKQHIEGLN